MSVLSNFATACADVTGGEMSGAVMLPARVAIALTRVLPVDAAAISVLDDLRVPLGASNADAEHAERLQITLGEGPCIASRTASPGPPFIHASGLAWRRWSSTTPPGHVRYPGIN